MLHAVSLKILSSKAQKCQQNVSKTLDYSVTMHTSWNRTRNRSQNSLQETLHKYNSRWQLSTVVSDVEQKLNLGTGPNYAHFPYVHSRKQKLAAFVYANGRQGGTVVTITLLFTFIIILLTVRLPTHLEQTKSVCTIIYLYVKKNVLCLKR
jgi:hypothetical protein